MLVKLTLSVFSFLFFFLSLFSIFFPLIFPFSSFFLVAPCFYFLIFKFSILSSSSPSVLLLYTARASFYSACRDQILLFQPLTTFVQSGCTCRPPCLCVTPHYQTKRTILFISLPWHPLPTTVWVPSLSLSLMTCTQWPNSALLVWVVCHPSRTLPSKSLGRNLKIGLPLSPPPNHALLPLTHDLTVSCIGWVQAGEAWVLCVPSFHMCPKSVCCYLVRCGLEACLHSLPFIL